MPSLQTLPAPASPRCLGCEKLFHSSCSPWSRSTSQEAPTTHPWFIHRCDGFVPRRTAKYKMKINMKMNIKMVMNIKKMKQKMKKKMNKNNHNNNKNK
jgi:hypothetical protein